MEKTITKTMSMAAVFMLFAFPVWAAGEVHKSSGQRIVEGLLPLIIIFSLLYFFLRRVGRRNEPFMERARLNMDTVEKQNERIIALLEEIAEKKRTPELTPPPLPRVPAGHSEVEG